MFFKYKSRKEVVSKISVVFDDKLKVFINNLHANMDTHHNLGKNNKDWGKHDLALQDFQSEIRQYIFDNQDQLTVENKRGEPAKLTINCRHYPDIFILFLCLVVNLSHHTSFYSVLEEIEMLNNNKTPWILTKDEDEGEFYDYFCACGHVCKTENIYMLKGENKSIMVGCDCIKKSQAISQNELRRLKTKPNGMTSEKADEFLRTHKFCNFCYKNLSNTTLTNCNNCKPLILARQTFQHWRNITLKHKNMRLFELRRVFDYWKNVIKKHKNIKNFQLRRVFNSWKKAITDKKHKKFLLLYNAVSKWKEAPRIKADSFRKAFSQFKKLINYSDRVNWDRRLAVSYDEKDDAKEIGAEWDKSKKIWTRNYFNRTCDIYDRFNLTVAFKNKDKAKLMGAQWDAKERTWFITRQQVEAFSEYDPKEDKKYYKYGFAFE